MIIRVTHISGKNPICLIMFDHKSISHQHSQSFSNSQCYSLHFQPHFHEGCATATENTRAYIFVVQKSIRLTRVQLCNIEYCLAPGKLQKLV